MSFFKGYVRTRQKKCIDKFKDAELRTLDEVKDLPEYAGILSADTVLIDVDDEKSAEKLLKLVEDKEVLCQVRKTTRGMHFYFKNDGSWDKCATGIPLAIGINADIKIGSKNSYAILKFGGEEREVIYDIFEGETYQSPPKWLHVVKSNSDLLSKLEGDGRNNALFSYIMNLQRAGFTKEQCIETLELVNNYIFDKPLSESEFKTITRDESFETNLMPSFFEGKKFLFEEFAKWLVREYHIKRINGQLHVYQDGVYVANTRKLENKMVKVLPSLSKANRTEVIEYIEVLCYENVNTSSVELIAFKNGILNIESGELLPFSPDIVVTNQIPWDYREGAYSEVVDRTLNKLACGDDQIRALLEECVGYNFWRRNELRKFFVFTGNKHNGKSTFINMISKMLGEENITSLDLKDLSHTFRPSELFGKLANLGDDIDSKFIENVANLKKFVSGDKVMVEQKYGQPLVFNSYAKFIFSANDLPRVKDRTMAVIDRMIIVPFDANFTKDDPDYDPFIIDKLMTKDSIEYLIALGVVALKRVLKQRGFTKSVKVDQALQGYAEEVNPIIIFFQDHEKDDFLRESVGYWYQAYCEHCLAYGCVALSRTAFSRQVLLEYDDIMIQPRKVNGESIRRFCRKKS